MEERALALKAKKPELDDLKQALGIDRITVQVEELEQQPKDALSFQANSA